MSREQRAKSPEPIAESLVPLFHKECGTQVGFTKGRLAAGGLVTTQVFQDLPGRSHVGEPWLSCPKCGGFQFTLVYADGLPTPAQEASVA